MDTPQRRVKRFQLREPESILQLTERDLFMLEVLHIHGPLPSSYLRAFARHVCKNDTGNTKRLRMLTDHGYLDRPIWQTGTGDPRIFDRQNLIVYDLTDKAIREMKERGMWSEYAPNGTDSDRHKCMTACITAAVHLGSLDAGIAYIPQHQILERAQTRLRFPITYEDPFTGNPITKTLVPDGVFGLTYKDATTAFFFVEADRDTEGGRTHDQNRKSFLRSLIMYYHLIGKSMYKDALKIQKSPAKVLNVTISRTRRDSLIEIAGDNEKGRNGAHLFQTIDGFGRIFKPPHVATHLFSGGWKRAGYPDFTINTPSSANR